MDEPTVPEMLRALQADVHRMLAIQEQYVTREILELKLGAVAKDQAEDREKLNNLTRMAWTVLIGPVIVGVVLYFLLGGKP